METLSLRHVTPETHQIFARRKNPSNPIQRRRICLFVPRFRYLIRAKRPRLQEFQGYAKPSRLFPATEVEVLKGKSVEKMGTSLKEDVSKALFKVDIGTSRINGSNLSDLNAGVLLCLIDENGDSILQRIPASSKTDSEFGSEVIHLQRGSIDEFIFGGPKLGRIEAIWISPESGQWRLGSLCLTAISGTQPSSKEPHSEEFQYSCLMYEFETEDALLGEGGNRSMVELRPCRITNLSQVNTFDLLSQTPSSESASPASIKISNEESMKEYADLKFSLLLYDTLLIFTGTSIASVSSGENSAIAFLAGGISGFLYLLLLQRSVDGLQAPDQNLQKTEDANQNFGGYKGSVSALVLAIGLALVTLKYGVGQFPMVLMPKDVVVGMLGFLSCKVAVVLAAVKPMTIGLKR